MEPRSEEQKTRESQPEAREARPRRFRIIKLEERIAPGGGTDKGTMYTCHWHTECHKTLTCS
jgi:hypothetical protein